MIDLQLARIPNCHFHQRQARATFALVALLAPYASIMDNTKIATLMTNLAEAREATPRDTRKWTEDDDMRLDEYETLVGVLLSQGKTEDAKRVLLWLDSLWGGAFEEVLRTGTETSAKVLVGILNSVSSSHTDWLDLYGHKLGSA